MSIYRTKCVFTCHPRGVVTNSREDTHTTYVTTSRTKRCSCAGCSREPTMGILQLSSSGEHTSGCSFSPHPPTRRNLMRIHSCSNAEYIQWRCIRLLLVQRLLVRVCPLGKATGREAGSPEFDSLGESTTTAGPTRPLIARPLFIEEGATF